MRPEIDGQRVRVTLHGGLIPRALYTSWEEIARLMAMTVFLMTAPAGTGLTTAQCTSLRWLKGWPTLGLLRWLPARTYKQGLSANDPRRAVKPRNPADAPRQHFRLDTFADTAARNWALRYLVAIFFKTQRLAHPEVLFSLIDVRGDRPRRTILPRLRRTPSSAPGMLVQCLLVTPVLGGILDLLFYRRQRRSRSRSICDQLGA